MLIKLKVLSTKVKQPKKSFLRYFTYVKMVVVGEEEKGRQEKSLNVHFTDDAKKQLPKDIRFFILTVDTDKNQIGMPRKYEIIEEEDTNGEVKTKYPELWVRGFEKCEKIESKPITEDVEFVVDEEPTKETEIDNNELSSND